ncbi:hypothetical protein GCM10007298_35160 [Williamsia phyllosphaerae]|uniref:DUF3027 domain-containing protein n=2 Tax=Williamsia phyllosphaerae TaxID=885042 RepID=A0ABQ1V4J9_9NOCA|nr:hypothetical protein GCM10007298_35160 [Williamsia phyllosphaerae]
MTSPAAVDSVGSDMPAEVEARLTAAVDAARSAVEASGEGAVGAHIRAVTEGDCTVTHYFEADITGYRGWVWCAVLASSPDTESGPGEITVSEIALLPGGDALTAPSWVPWIERIAPGDLSPGDVLAAPADDVRLVPNHIDTAELTSTGDLDEVSDVALELGLGRSRVLSREGRDDAAQRWFEGPRGPESDMATASRLHCGTCGFYLPVAGSLRVAFGVCANEYASDGQVVSAEFGCGAHSDAEAPSGEGSPAYDAYDDGAIEIVAASD